MINKNIETELQKVNLLKGSLSWNNIKVMLLDKVPIYE